ncbi:hypothetical protein ABGV42_04150 [Paenibacillus pabuli]
MERKAGQFVQPFGWQYYEKHPDGVLGSNYWFIPLPPAGLICPKVLESDIFCEDFRRRGCALFETL